MSRSLQIQQFIGGKRRSIVKYVIYSSIIFLLGLAFIVYKVISSQHFFEKLDITVIVALAGIITSIVTIQMRIDEYKQELIGLKIISSKIDKFERERNSMELEKIDSLIDAYVKSSLKIK